MSFNQPYLSNSQLYNSHQTNQFGKLDKITQLNELDLPRQSMPSQSRPSQSWPNQSMLSQSRPNQSMLSQSRPSQSMQTENSQKSSSTPVIAGVHSSTTNSNFRFELGIIIIGALVFTASFLWKDMLTDIEEKFFPKGSGLTGRVLYVIFVTFVLIILALYIRDILGLSGTVIDFEPSVDADPTRYPGITQ